MHCLHCGLLTNLKAEPHPHTKPVSTVQTSAHVSLSPSRGHIQDLRALASAHNTAVHVVQTTLGLAGPGQRHSWFLFTKELSQ